VDRTNEPWLFGEDQQPAQAPRQRLLRDVANGAVPERPTAGDLGGPVAGEAQGDRVGHEREALGSDRLEGLGGEGADLAPVEGLGKDHRPPEECQHPRGEGEAGEPFTRQQGLGQPGGELGAGGRGVAGTELDTDHPEGGAGDEGEGAVPEREGERRAARVAERPDLGLGQVYLEVEEGAPVKVPLDQGDEVGPLVRRQSQVVGVAGGGYPSAALDCDPKPLPGSPAMEGLHEDVEEVGAGRAPLGEAVPGLPFLAIDLAEAEALAEAGVEGAEAPDGAGTPAWAMAPKTAHHGSAAKHFSRSKVTSQRGRLRRCWRPMRSERSWATWQVPAWERNPSTDAPR
jgi:hypothetical protein